MHTVVFCRYQWACTAPNENGEQYIPRERNHDEVAVLTESGVLLIYRIPNLSTNCYSQVTAIEYCYRYNANTVTGQATFNWMVLILKETDTYFEISRIYVIQSYGSVNDASCKVSGEQVMCCDKTSINRFDLSQNFSFGVTKSSQGSTAGATLLGFADALPWYQVDVVLINRAEVTLSVGSIIRNRQTTKRGIRMLWFVINGEFNLACSFKLY